MLDVGAGTGFMALAALREHAERATATDTNRAVAALRPLQRDAERRSTSASPSTRAACSSPSGDERFDLVLCNPPYLVSPENAFVYRDGGEGICRALVEAAPRHLEEGGIFICLASWTHAKDADWQGPLRAWTAGSGCDVLAFGLASSDPLTYAAGWGRAPGRDLVVTAPRLERWLAWFDGAGHRARQLGRRPAAPPLGGRELVPRRDAAGRGQRLRGPADPPPARRPGPAAAARAGAGGAARRAARAGARPPHRPGGRASCRTARRSRASRCASPAASARASRSTSRPRRRWRRSTAAGTPRVVLHAAAQGIGAEDPDAFARARRRGLPAAARARAARARRRGLSGAVSCGAADARRRARGR